MILKTEQTTIVYAYESTELYVNVWIILCDKTYGKHWLSYQNSFKGNEESALLRTGLSHATSRLSIFSV